MAKIPTHVNMKLEVINDEHNFIYRFVNNEATSNKLYTSIAKESHKLVEQSFFKSLYDEQLGNLMLELSKELKTRHSDKLQENYYAYVEHPEFRCEYNCRRDNNNGVWQSEGYLDKEEYMNLFNDPKTVTLKKIEKDYIVCVTEKFDV